MQEKDHTKVEKEIEEELQVLKWKLKEEWSCMQTTSVGFRMGKNSCV